ncbi:MAG: alpha/beta hydrolase-fold protein [Ginsengibacter sp.]
MKRILVITFLLLQVSFLKAQDSPSFIKSTPFILGKIVTLPSKILNEKRTLNIYLPEGYLENDTTRYPVIYLLDGSADEDFIHIAGLVQFLNFQWVNILPKSILVGIANVDRKRDFTFPTTVEEDKKESPTSGGSSNFIAFIQKELQPFIEKNYKTNSTKTLIGQSLGGLLATEILFKTPGLFTRYIIVSPSLWWNNESLLKIKPLIDKNNSSIINIAVGNEGKIMENDARNLEQILKENRKNSVVHFEYFPHENHATILHRAVYKAFEYFNTEEKTK